ncbi:beta-ketoacyl-[acyl-carrier-protein] synthase family protein [Streptomyces sp. NBC_00237]|uniref:beta-ketoacyl-[acyl-carrier-protein] synthase family protein n=1 Tax=Streptomyces sp. NBC_00237 TaxID=2975687 RepID=UPI002250161E|nr:beta-ketoacyl-[acyl-carrier-protein] synthase family protein [Streptomyces sp. NBC_00237]MCX5205220.1 beta-ketoacyl-[acyl-carrier-protein] synthase family protein [Streptomyces sp. NBC_00237]
MKPAFAPVVTGIGLVTAAGPDRDTTWAAVREGRPTAAPDPRLHDLPVSLTCRVPALDHPVLRQRGSASLDPVARLGLAATAQALEHADLDPSAWDGSRVAVVTGHGTGGVHSEQTAAARLADRGPGSVSAYFLTGYLINMAGANIALRFGITGPTTALSTACASGTTALGTARDLLATGQCDIAVVCGAEFPLTRLVVTGFTQLGALSNHSSRPFDAARDGFVIAEGAGTLILERPEHAAARGARPLARLIGYGASTDAHHLVAPHPEGRGAERAVRAALADAGLLPEDVDHINAHGTSTPRNDEVEGALLRRVFPHRPPVTSAKGSLGHTMGAAGVIEAALTVLALREDVVPPTAGLTELDKALDIDVVMGAERAHASSIALSTSFGFGGHNAAVVLARA